MAALTSQVARVFNAFLNSGINGENVSYVGYPENDDINLVGGAADVYGAWVEIVAAATVTVQSWLSHININTGSLAAGTDYVVQYGEGAAGAETGYVAVYYIEIQVTAAGRTLGYNVPLLFPREIAATTRLAGRVKSGAGTPDNLNVKLTVAQGL